MGPAQSPKKNEIASCFQSWLKVRIKARPVGNQANKELLTFIARKVNLKINQLVLVSGQTSRKKVISISKMKQFDWPALEY